jgi:hypothetical protein
MANWDILCLSELVGRFYPHSLSETWNVPFQ